MQLNPPLLGGRSLAMVSQWSVVSDWSPGVSWWSPWDLLVVSWLLDGLRCYAGILCWDLLVVPEWSGGRPGCRGPVEFVEVIKL